MKDANLIEFGRVIRELRKERGLSQEAFADLAGIDRGYMGNIERGKSNVTLTKVFQLSDALKLRPQEIFQRLEMGISEKQLPNLE
jgi:transcriptional regulator with XRE-family HTH domain